MAFRKAKITSRLVDSLKPGETIMDTDLPGYMVRRQQGEARIYAVRKAALARRHFVTIGADGREGWTETKARAAALQIIADLRRGHDPAAERAKVKAMPTLVEYCEQFIEKREGTLKPRTLDNYRSFLALHIAVRDEDGKLQRDCLGRVKLDAVTRAHVTALHKHLREKPRTANHVVAFLSAVFTEAALDDGPLRGAQNPVQKLRRYKERRRERFLSDEEIARVSDALAEAERGGTSPYAIAAIRLLILTGCRKNELLRLRWDYVDLQRGMLHLPDSKTEEKVVYLSPPAKEVLANLPRIDGNPYVFVGAGEGEHYVGLQAVWARIRTAAKLQPVTLPNGKQEHVRIHDLRHSFASLMAASGASLPMIGKLLGHKNPNTTQRYAHLCDDPLKRVNDAVGVRVGATLKSRDDRGTEVVL